MSFISETLPDMTSAVEKISVKERSSKPYLSPPQLQLKQRDQKTYRKIFVASNGIVCTSSSDAREASGD